MRENRRKEWAQVRRDIQKQYLKAYVSLGSPVALKDTIRSIVVESYHAGYKQAGEMMPACQNEPHMGTPIGSDSICLGTVSLEAQDEPIHSGNSKALP